ncbi:unnamed protein product, partial [Adineta steineri]
QCVFNEALLRIANCYLSNAGNINITATISGKIIANGYLEYVCAPGYTSNPTIGTRLTCFNNGSWSPLPVCQPINPCPSAPLFTFLQNQSASLTLNSSYNLPRNETDNNYVVSGAFVPATCRTGYINIAGPLNITCVNGTWTRYPNCILNISNVSMTSIMTTTAKVSIDAPCPIEVTTFSIENGFLVHSSTLILPFFTYQGRITFGCKSGYMIDPAISALYECNNGVWSTKPRCLKIDNCSISNLTALLSSTPQLQTTGLTKLIQIPDNPTLVRDGSYVVFSCMSGYGAVSGSLSVTCINSSWTQFPTCVPLIQGVISPYEYDYYIYPFSCSLFGWRNRNECLNITKFIYNCSIPSLTKLLPSIPGLQVTDQIQLKQIPEESTLVHNGSYVVFSCMSGYTNAGGNLNVMCMNGSWTQAPECVPISQVTKVSSTGKSACPYLASMINITNGHASNLSGLTLSVENKAASGSFIDYQCVSPFTLKGNSRMICENGVWSALPVCTANSGCSVSELQSVLVKMRVISKSLSVSDNGDILVGGWIQLQCAPGLILLSGSLNITCKATGTWTQFPICS